MKRAKTITAYRHDPPKPEHHGCSCHANPQGTTYYTSARDGKRAVALSGPYGTHEEALAKVDAARDAAYKVDQRACWYGYGTFAAKPGAVGILTAFCSGCLTFIPKDNRGPLCGACARPAAKEA